MATGSADDRTALLERLLAERILILDGAMGTMIQTYRLDEADFRGRALRGPRRATSRATTTSSPSRARTIIEAIHREYLAGRRRHHRDQHLQRQQHLAGRLRPRGPRLRDERRRGAGGAARRGRGDGRAIRAARASWPGPSGPTNRTTSMSRDVTDPGRAADHLRGAAWPRITSRRAACSTAASTSCSPETTFDTLNLKAALFAIEQLFDEGQRRVPGHGLASPSCRRAATAR